MLNFFKTEFKLFKLINFIDTIKNLNLDGYSFVNFSVGFNKNAYILTCKPCNENNCNKYVYAVIEVIIDWNNKKVLDTKYFLLGVHRFEYNLIQPIENDFLLIYPRSNYNDGNPNKNGIVIDRGGNVKKYICFGDGILNCIVRKDNSIITSYFDEGIFGNYGWEYPVTPIGNSGLILWDKDGNILWENKKYDISDCYAISLDTKENLWFYYYTDFNLVKTDFHNNDELYASKLHGSSGFVVNSNLDKFLFRGGYGDYNSFYILSKASGKIKKSSKVKLTFNSNELQISNCSLTRPQMLFMVSQDIYAYEF